MYRNWYSFNDGWHLSDKVKTIGKYLNQIQNNRHKKLNNY